MSDFAIGLLVIPLTICASDADDFVEMSNVRNEIESNTSGNRGAHKLRGTH